MTKICVLCGGTNIGVRNAYGNNYPLIGFAAEDYCKDCDVSLADGPRLKEYRKQLRRMFDRELRTSGERANKNE